MDEAIVLAGGKGTRIKSISKNIPKCLIKINGIPFLNYLIKYLLSNNIKKIVFALGYKHDQVLEYINKNFYNLNYDYTIEKDLLGTGGAINLALKKTVNENVFIVNGDSYIETNLDLLREMHLNENADCSIILKKMKNFERYGEVKLNKNRIIKFNEKKKCNIGYVNTGYYLLNKNSFTNLPNTKFSFEKSFLEKSFLEKSFYGLKVTDYFIDYGVPKDYNKFVKYLK